MGLFLSRSDLVLIALNAFRVAISAALTAISVKRIAMEALRTAMNVMRSAISVTLVAISLALTAINAVRTAMVFTYLSDQTTLKTLVITYKKKKMAINIDEIKKIDVSAYEHQINEILEQVEKSTGGKCLIKVREGRIFLGVAIELLQTKR